MLAEEGKAKAIAFDQIDKALEEKKRITIADIVCCSVILIIYSSLNALFVVII